MTKKWVQMQNYLRKKEQKEQRERELREGLKLYKWGGTLKASIFIS